MRLREWAERNSVSKQTAWRMFHQDMIPNARQLPTGTIVIDEFPKVSNPENVIIYARVSSSQNKNNLDSQAERLIQYCTARGYHITSVIKEIGSGVNDRRPKLLNVLSDKECTKIVVEHKDRLTRFGFQYLDTLLAQKNVAIEIVNDVETDKEDLMQDLISIITSMCARYYGQRRSKRKTEKIIEALKNDKEACPDTEGLDAQVVQGLSEAVEQG